MITDEALLSEIQTDPAGLGYAGAGASIIHGLINAEGSASVEAWIPAPTEMPRNKGDFLKILTTSEAAALEDFINGGTTEGKALRFLLNQSDLIDMAHSTIRQRVTDLATASILSTTTRDAMLRLGEIRKSRAQELWSEAVPLDQIKRVLGAT